uniref:Uncharacterized protein n=1 Tax=Ciona savignyi TaxID=51511 RepID=H2YYF4_CIOSA
MDRASELTDAFVEVKFGSTSYKTEVFGKSLNPVWNSEWFKFELDLFADYNQFKQSSCGLKFICGTSLPECYLMTSIHGFVEELLVNEDPEYKWIDKLRTPRASNEARQRLFSKMSGELQRRIGSKVENMGGNAVVGYQQSFDIEGDSGIVVRGIGTAVTVE